MPTSRFFDLDSQKRQRIIDACTTEFSAYGYENSSTNRIIADSSISKGSLFKYFDSKEELYLYVLDLAVSEMTADLGKSAATLPSDPFELAVEYSVLEFSWYAQHPEKARLIIRAFTRSNSDVYRKIEEKYSGQSEDIYYRLLDNIDADCFLCDRQKAIDILKWFLMGFNEDFRQRVQYGAPEELDALQDKYVEALTAHMEILRSALIK